MDPGLCKSSGVNFSTPPFVVVANLLFKTLISHMISTFLFVLAKCSEQENQMPSR